MCSLTVFMCLFKLCHEILNELCPWPINTQYQMSAVEQTVRLLLLLHCTAFSQRKTNDLSQKVQAILKSYVFPSTISDVLSLWYKKMWLCSSFALQLKYQRVILNLTIKPLRGFHYLFLICMCRCGSGHSAHRPDGSDPGHLRLCPVHRLQRAGESVHSTRMDAQSHSASTSVLTFAYTRLLSSTSRWKKCTNAVLSSSCRRRLAPRPWTWPWPGRTRSWRNMAWTCWRWPCWPSSSLLRWGLSS